MTAPETQPDAGLVADEVEALRVASAAGQIELKFSGTCDQPDHLPGLLARLDATTAKLTSETEENAKLRARVEELESLICRIEPHIDAIVCYASTMGEHEPNRIAHEVRAIAGRTQDQLVGEAIAAQIIARIDAAHPASQEETGWLVELKGHTPSWSTLFAGDYDDHWTEDSTKATRFARKVDAEAWIAWHGWTEAFASEHIWDDGRTNLGDTDER